MADLVNKRKINVISSGGLSARIAQAELHKEIGSTDGSTEGLDPLKMEHRLCLMLDCSGSMCGERISNLSSAVQDFVQKADFSNTAIAIETFPNGLRLPLMTDKTALWLHCMSFEASGGTPMSEAMEYSFQNCKMTRGIIISDGQPDSSERCKNWARSFKEKEIPLDCIHIGDSSSGEELLKSLSEITGGLFVKFKDTSSFAQAMHFLLPETRSEAAKLFLTAGANEVKS
jgi:Mg-chelatase subunit ChlD